MKKIFLIPLLCFLCFSSLGRSHARQQDALSRHLHTKFSNKGKIDTTFSDEFQAIDESKTLSSQVECTKESDKIEKLPGQPDVGFDQYGGYVTVDEKHGRAFYYYFVEAEESKEKKPLLLWLNGGPGCSSIGNGAFEEQGPFRVLSDGKTLFHNPYAWNKVANVIFLESPAWVGFSYSNTSSDIDLSGDKNTAEDNYVFLLNWLKRFPEYKDRDLYLSGESYAGHYVPQLAHTILQHNKKANKNIVNLKGIIIGNALINDETDMYGRYDYWWTHALISDETIYNIHKYCDFSPNATDATEPPKCNSAREVAESSISQGDVDIIDIYDIYAPICLKNGLTEEPKRGTIIIDPCSDIYVSAYLNTPAVQEALHANVTKAGDPWATCNDSVHNAWGDSPSTVLPLLHEFLASGLRVWVFSGDTDGILPVTSTRYSLKKLNLRLKEHFRPWFHHEEVGGYTQTYEGNLTFATVRGAGHMVPSHQPQRALSLIKHFLAGKPLPSS